MTRSEGEIIKVFYNSTLHTFEEYAELVYNELVCADKYATSKGRNRLNDIKGKLSASTKIKQGIYLNLFLRNLMLEKGEVILENIVAYNKPVSMKVYESVYNILKEVEQKFTENHNYYDNLCLYKEVQKCILQKTKEGKKKGERKINMGKKDVDILVKKKNKKEYMAYEVKLPARIGGNVKKTVAMDLFIKYAYLVDLLNINKIEDLKMYVVLFESKAIKCFPSVPENVLTGREFLKEFTNITYSEFYTEMEKLRGKNNEISEFDRGNELVKELALFFDDYKIKVREIRYRGFIESLSRTTIPRTYYKG